MVLEVIISSFRETRPDAHENLIELLSQEGRITDLVTNCITDANMHVVLQEMIVRVTFRGQVRVVA